MDTVTFNTHMFEQIAHESKFPACIVITFQVMAFTRMSTGYPYTVSPLPQGRQDVFRAQTACAGNPYHPDIGRILHPGDTGKIGCTIAAPVAKESNYLNLILTHCFYSSPHSLIFFSV